MVADPPLLVLDACCAINLLASGVIDDVLSMLPYRFAVADLVAEREVLHLRPEDPAPRPDLSESYVPASRSDADAVVSTVTLNPLVQAGLLQVLTAEGPDELQTFVSLALQLDDGEALSAALAIHRRAVLVTDDRKALRVVGGAAPGLELRRTSSLLKEWAEAADVDAERLRAVLTNVRQRGSFVPPRDDPERGWWERGIRGVG